MTPRISYCSPLMNRHRQLMETLSDNCLVVAAFKGRVEWVIVNIRRYDDDAEWAQSDAAIRSEGANLIRRGWLTYATATMATYHQSICKNLVARAAHGDFLINLDIDNKISIKDTVQLLGRGSDIENTLYHGWDGKWGTGTSGMLGLPRAVFHGLGGYNEEFQPYGYDEYDLMLRAQLGAPTLQVARFCSRATIANTDEERSRHLGTAALLQDMNAANREISRANILAGRLTCTPTRSAAIALSVHTAEDATNA